MAAGLLLRPGRTRPAPAVRAHDHGRLLCLIAAVVLGSSPHGRFVPGAGIDPSWVTALNMAAGQRLDFGKDIVYMYGPLGFLDVPMAIHTGQLAAGLVFYALAVGILWFALDVALGRIVRQPWAAVAALALSVLLASYSTAALELLIAAPIFAILSIYPGWGRGRVPAALAVMAAVLIQVKFTDGVFIGLFALLAAICAGYSAVRRTVEVIIAFAAALLTGWTLAGQSVPDLWPWFTGSMHISFGYADAMAAEEPLNLLPYVLAAALALVIVVLAVRWTHTTRPRPRIGVLAIILAALYIGFKEGFVRHEPYHQAAYFSACVPLLAILAAVPRRRSVPLAALLVALVFSANSLAWLNPFTAPARWNSNVQILFDPHYRNDQLAAEKAVLQKSYNIPSAMLAAVDGHPVMIDPWESSAAWAYSLRFHPVPMFQTFTAYDKDIDEMNAQALRHDPADQMILRQPRSFGLRDHLWTSPRYTLALACHYAVQSTSLQWMLLHKAANVCGPAHTIDTTRVRAGQRLPVPTGGPDQIVVAEFTADGGGVGNAVVNLLWKDVHRLYVTADGTKHMLARSLAGGPLIVSLPAALGWPDRFQTGAPYHHLSFSSPGRVRFQTITVDSNK